MKQSSGKSMRIVDSSDFVVRKYGPSLPQIFIVCLAVLAAAIIMTLTIYDRTALLSMLFILAGMTSWYVTNQVRHNREMLQATEFQNALFASALGAHHKFCMIIRNDQSIIYFDRHFQQQFPDFVKQGAHTLSRWLEHVQSSKEDGDKIAKAIASNEDSTVQCRLKAEEEQVQSITLLVEPILRPSGFILLRGSAA